MKNKIEKIKLSRMGKEYEVLSKIFNSLKSTEINNGDTIFYINKYEIILATDIKNNKLLFSIKNIWNKINLFRLDRRYKYDLIKTFIDLYFPTFSNFNICTIDDLIPCGTIYKWVNNHNINKTFLYEIDLKNFNLYKSLKNKITFFVNFKIDDLVYYNGSSYIKFDNETKKQIHLPCFNLNELITNDFIKLDYNKKEDNKIFYKSRPHFLISKMSTNYFFQ